MEEADQNFKTKKIETDVVKCPSCGGTMVFDPELQALKCEHCGNVSDFKKDFEVVERNIAEGFENAELVGEEEQVAYRCSNCGAEVVINSDETATICPFCGTSHVAKEGSFKGIRPQVVIPFQFGKDKASDFAKKWAKRRLFAPGDFKKKLEPENVHGVYEPCFTFDSDTKSTYYGRVGDIHTRTVGSGKNRRTETYVVYRNVSGVYNEFFDDVMVATNAKFDQRKMDMLSPFDRSRACNYEKKFLSGFFADKYQKNLSESWDDAKKIIDSRIRKDIENSLHCDEVDYLNISTTHTGVTYKYVLLPVYRLVYGYKGKDYGVMINGSSGKVKGKTPKSAIKVLIAVVLAIAAAVGLGFLAFALAKSGALDDFMAISRKIFTSFPLKSLK